MIAMARATDKPRAGFLIPDTYVAMPSGKLWTVTVLQ